MHSLFRRNDGVRSGVIFNNFYFIISKVIKFINHLGDLGFQCAGVLPLYSLFPSSPQVLPVILAKETVQETQYRRSCESRNPVKHTNPQGFSRCNMPSKGFLHSRPTLAFCQNSTSCTLSSRPCGALSQNIVYEQTGYEQL